MFFLGVLSHFSRFCHPQILNGPGLLCAICAVLANLTAKVIALLFRGFFLHTIIIRTQTRKEMEQMENGSILKLGQNSSNPDSDKFRQIRILMPAFHVNAKKLLKNIPAQSVKAKKANIRFCPCLGSHK
jgi:hypothetical protein